MKIDFNKTGDEYTIKITTRSVIFRYSQVHKEFLRIFKEMTRHQEKAYHLSHPFFKFKFYPIHLKEYDEVVRAREEFMGINMRFSKFIEEKVKSRRKYKNTKKKFEMEWRKRIMNDEEMAKTELETSDNVNYEIKDEMNFNFNDDKLIRRINELEIEIKNKDELMDRLKQIDVESKYDKKMDMLNNELQLLKGRELELEDEIDDLQSKLRDARNNNSYKTEKLRSMEVKNTDLTQEINSLNLEVKVLLNEMRNCGKHRSRLRMFGVVDDRKSDDELDDDMVNDQHDDELISDLDSDLGNLQETSQIDMPNSDDLDDYDSMYDS